MPYPVITFSHFNTDRWLNGVEAAQFDIDSEGARRWVWMSIGDIEKNIDLFPHCATELQKGLDHYGPSGLAQ